MDSKRSDITDHTSTSAALVGKIKEKIHSCMDKCLAALTKIKTERQEFLNHIDKLTEEKKVLSEQLADLKKEFQGVTKIYINYSYD